MMRNNFECYDSISIEMLELLTEFSNSINRITKLNDFLLTNCQFNQDCDFRNYIYYFNKGRYYHFRCMGFMESLVVTKCYSIKSLCYWKNKLVMPASDNFMEALDHLMNLECKKTMRCNQAFKALLAEIERFKMISMEIMDLIECYNLPC